MTSWYQRNKERALACGREYAKSHRKENVKKALRYKRKNREKVLAYLRGYYRRNSERLKAICAVYRKNNKEKVNAYQKALRETMKESGLYKKYRESMRCRYVSAKSYAKRRSLAWNILESDYSELMSKTCVYCDGKLPLHGTGLDRMDNSKGYIIGNIVPCCSGCNRVKSDQLTFNEMKIAMNAVKEFRLNAVLQGII